MGDVHVQNTAVPEDFDDVALLQLAARLGVAVSSRSQTTLSRQLSDEERSLLESALFVTGIDLHHVLPSPDEGGRDRS